MPIPFQTNSQCNFFSMSVCGIRVIDRATICPIPSPNQASTRDREPALGHLGYSGGTCCESERSVELENPYSSVKLRFGGSG